MARATKKEEVLEEKVMDEVSTHEEVVTADLGDTPAEKTYALNGYNFTAVGEHFLTLCNSKVKIKTDNKPLFNAAEEQVKLGVLKVVNE